MESHDGKPVSDVIVLLYRLEEELGMVADSASGSSGRSRSRNTVS